MRITHSYHTVSAIALRYINSYNFTNATDGEVNEMVDTMNSTKNILIALALLLGVSACAPSMSNYQQVDYSSNAGTVVTDRALYSY